MCDFRHPPDAVIDLQSKQKIPVNYHGTKVPQEPQVGIYYIVGTGSYYAYYDGSGWFNDRNDWGPPSKYYWQDTGGIPPKFNRYEFIFSESSEQARNRAFCDFQPLFISPEAMKDLSSWDTI